MRPFAGRAWRRGGMGNVAAKTRARRSAIPYTRPPTDHLQWQQSDGPTASATGVFPSNSTATLSALPGKSPPTPASVRLSQRRPFAGRIPYTRVVVNTCRS